MLQPEGMFNLLMQDIQLPRLCLIGSFHTSDSNWKSFSTHKMKNLNQNHMEPINKIMHRQMTSQCKIELYLAFAKIQRYRSDYNQEMEKSDSSKTKVEKSHVIMNRYFLQFQEEAKCHENVVDLDSNLKYKFIISNYRKINLGFFYYCNNIDTKNSFQSAQRSN